MESSHPVDRAVRGAPWFRPGARVLAAVSGGPDSMALLAAAGDLPGVRVTAAHFDHGIRSESARDIETVRAFADSRGIEVIAGSADVPARARSARVSIETAARGARYAFLREAAARAGADWIATAHTRSDHVETVLMRVLRGAGVRGLAGIAREHDGVVRPLLDVARADTVDYCARRGIPIVVDSTNADRRFRRNAIRHDVLPALRRAFPGIDAALLRTSRLAAEMLRAARSVTDVRVARALQREDDAWVLAIDAFDSLDDTAAAVLIGDALERMGFLEDITAAHYEAALALVPDDRVGVSADLPGVRVRRDHDALVWRTHTAVATGEAVLDVWLEIPGVVKVNGWTVMALHDRGGHEAGLSGQSRRPSGHGATPDWNILGRARPSVGAGARGGAENRVRVPRLVAATTASTPAGTPLIVRAPRPGDRVRPFGMTGTKKLSDILIDRKIPHRERARLVVIESNGEIVWVPGVVAAESTRVRDGDAPVLRLTASREAE